MRRTAAGIVATVGLLAAGGVAQAHTLPLAGAKKLAQKLEASQRILRPGTTDQTLTSGRRVSPHRIVFHYTEFNRDRTFTCAADIVVKYVNASTNQTIAYFSNVLCGRPH